MKVLIVFSALCLYTSHASKLELSQAAIKALKPKPPSEAIDYSYICCNDEVPNLVPKMHYDQMCGLHGTCRLYINGTLGCHCDSCHYGEFCQFTYPEPGCGGNICPPPERPTCESFVPGYYERISFNQACQPNGVCIPENGEPLCRCDRCFTGPFCQTRTNLPGCHIDEPCTPPPPPQPSCGDIVLYTNNGYAATYEQACIVDPHNPHGECFIEGGEHRCRCNRCWTGLFCEQPSGEADCGEPATTCATVSPVHHHINCSSLIPGLFPGKTFHQACAVDLNHPQGHCVGEGENAVRCECNHCWDGAFCEHRTESPECSLQPACTTPKPLTCADNVPQLFPPQSYNQACEVDIHNPHGVCIEGQGGDNLKCECNACWGGSFCEEYLCYTQPTCPTTTPEPEPTCQSSIPNWHNSNTYDEECGVLSGRGHCQEANDGKLRCVCNPCWTGDFCETNSCIRRCAYEGLRPAFYHDPVSEYLNPKPEPLSDLPEDLLRCAEGFECVPDDKNCFFDRQQCINNIGWCIPETPEAESPAHPSDSQHH